MQNNNRCSWQHVLPILSNATPVGVRDMRHHKLWAKLPLEVGSQQRVRATTIAGLATGPVPGRPPSSGVSKNHSSGGSVRLVVCNPISGNILCEVHMDRHASVRDIKAKICSTIRVPQLLQVVLMGSDELCDDFEQPLALVDSESITLSLLQRRWEPSEEDALEALERSSGCLSKDEIVYFSRSVPEFSWDALAPHVARSYGLAPNRSDIIAAILVRNGSEEGAKAAIGLFMHVDQPSMGHWKGMRLLSNRGYGGRGTYQHWLHSFDRFHHPSSITYATQLLSRLGFDGLRAVMEAFNTTLAHAGDCQKALLLLCAAYRLPQLSVAQAAVCAEWFVLLLQSTSPELRVCGIVCMQRIMAGYYSCKAPEVNVIGERVRDEVPAVRRAAIVALGCLGCQASPFQEELLAQLEDSSASIRYAALVTLGGLQAVARPRAHRIANLLNDEVTACRLAALRALRCIGATPLATLAMLQEGRNAADCMLLAARYAVTAPADAKAPCYHLFWRSARASKHMHMPDPAVVQAAFARNEHGSVRSWMSVKLRTIQRRISKLEHVAQPLSIGRAKKIARLRMLEQACSAILEAATR